MKLQLNHHQSRHGSCVFESGKEAIACACFLPTSTARFPFKRTQRTQRKRLRCVRCVNEKRKQRKCLIGCFDDWLFRSTIPIGWRLRSLREKSYAMFFARVIFLRLLRFLRTFYFTCVFCLTQDLACVALRAFEWKPSLRLRKPRAAGPEAASPVPIS